MEGKCSALHSSTVQEVSRRTLLHPAVKVPPTSYLLPPRSVWSVTVPYPPKVPYLLPPALPTLPDRGSGRSIDAIHA